VNAENFENAIVAEVKRATGLADGKVIWAHQSRDRPARPFIELRYVSDEAAGSASESYVTDTPSPTPGNEITLTTVDHTDFSVRLTAFSAAVRGAGSAREMLRTVRKHFGKESTVEAFSVLPEPIAITERSAVSDASIVLETEFEGRAFSTLNLRVADVSTETTTYIETVIIETTITQTTGDIVNTLTITP